MVEPGATAADVLRRRKCGSEKAERQDVSPPSTCIHEPRAGTVRARTRGKLPASSGYAPKKRSLLEHRRARRSLSRQYAASRRGECRLPVGLGERVLCERIHSSQWCCATDNSSQRLSWVVVKPGRAEAQLSCGVSGRQQGNTAGIRLEKR